MYQSLYWHLVLLPEMVTAGFEPAIPMYPTLTLLLQAHLSGVLPFHYVTGGATPPVEVGGATLALKNE